MAEKFECSGQLVKVWLKTKNWHAQAIMRKTNFLYSHKCYVNPVDFVADKPNVALFFVDEKCAVFCVTKVER